MKQPSASFLSIGLATFSLQFYFYFSVQLSVIFSYWTYPEGRRFKYRKKCDDKALGQCRVSLILFYVNMPIVEKKIWKHFAGKKKHKSTGQSDIVIIFDDNKLIQWKKIHSIQSLMRIDINYFRIFLSEIERKFIIYFFIWTFEPLIIFDC